MRRIFSMRIDENIIAQARTADVLAFFEKHNGFTFAHRGESTGVSNT